MWRCYFQDIGRANRFAGCMVAGTIWINIGSILDGPTRWGGYKQSGIGREMGHDPMPILKVNQLQLLLDNKFLRNLYMNDQINLPLIGKVALITGASSGIGQGTARALAQAGASVAIAARRMDKLRAFEKELVDEGVKVLSVELDVTSASNCEAAISSVITKFGSLDILVNSAGVMLLGPVQDGNVNQWADQIKTNLLGLMYMTRYAIPYLIKTRGTVVQISSTASRVVNPNGGPYSATKWGVNGFSEGLRREVSSKGVKVVVIEPGIAQTELREHITDQEARESINNTAASIRQLQPSDIGETIVFAVTRPDHVVINELLIRPLDQSF